MLGVWVGGWEVRGKKQLTHLGGLVPVKPFLRPQWSAPKGFHITLLLSSPALTSLINDL